MLRRIVIAALLAGIFVPGAAAARIPLAPGITYERQLLFTPHGPEVIHVMTAPKPGGLYALHPVLSNDSVIGRERVTSMQKRLASTATVGGVNADLFTFNEGLPSGMFMQSGVLAQPAASEALHRRDHERRAAPRAARPDARDVAGHQPAPSAERHSTSDPGPRASRSSRPPGAPRRRPRTTLVEITLSGVPPAVPLTDLTGTVVSVKPAGGTPIPPGGAVLVGRGTSAGRLASEAPVGETVTSRLVLRPQWAGVVDAVGGGPLIVQNGQPVFRALEQFSSSQLSVRNPRTAVGQRADGRIIFMTVDGRQPGYSTGLTNFELAQQMVRLGAVTASSLDAGGSTTMAFDGKLLNQPSDPVVSAQSPTGSSSSTTASRRRLCRCRCSRRTGTAWTRSNRSASKSSDRRPSPRASSARTGFRGRRRPGSRSRAPTSWTWNGRTAQGAPEPEGRWRWVINAVDDSGQQSRAERAFYLNSTLGYLRVSPSRVVVRRRGGSLRVSFRLAHPARVVLKIRTSSGATVRTISRRFRAGRASMRWNGRYGSGVRAFSGPYVASLRALNSFGPAQLERRFAVRRGR